MTRTDNTLPIGRRVAYWRNRRHLTQQQFADLIGKSKSWVDKVERGIRHLDRVSVLHDIASALRLDISRFVDPAQASRPQPISPISPVGPVGPAVAEIHAALTRYTPGPEPIAPARPAQPLSALRGAVNHGWLSLHHAAYDWLLRALPAVLGETHHAWATRRDDTSAGLLAETYQITATALRKVGELHPAWLAAERALTLATSTGSPLLAARAVVPLGGVVRDLGQPRQAMEICIRFARHLTAPATPHTAHLPVYGCLLLQAAMGAAQLGDRRGADELLNQAAHVATRLDTGPNDHWTTFGTALVQVVRVAAAIETGDTDQAITHHRQITAQPDHTRLPAATRADHWIDTARAYLLAGDVLAAGHALTQADRIAPAEVRARPTARDIITTVLRRSVRPDPHLIEIGRATGLDGTR